MEDKHECYNLQRDRIKTLDRRLAQTTTFLSANWTLRAQKTIKRDWVLLIPTTASVSQKSS